MSSGKVVYIHADVFTVLRELWESVDNPDGAEVSLTLVVTSEGVPMAWSYGDMPERLREYLKAMAPAFWMDDLPVSDTGYAGPESGLDSSQEKD
jgi:hypothetical protein